MADLVIRGMELPETCFMCPFMFARSYCSANLKIEFNDENYSELLGRHKDCPLVPLPEGHGELIDRDALKKRTPMVIDYSAGGFGTDGSIRPVRGYGNWQIDQAPTIVPAEGGGEKC